MVLIVTPARRVDEFLQETIRAVARQENASPFRHVVVMDNSDPLPEGERKPGYSIEFIRNTRSPGPAGARNTALDLAQVGEIVFFIDGDDLWPAAYLATVQAYYARHSSIQGVACPGIFFGEGSGLGRFSSPLLAPGEIPRRDFAWNPIGCPSGFSFRVTQKNHLVRFPESLRLCEDYAFYLLLASSAAGPIHALPEQFFLYRRSVRQSTASVSKAFVFEQRIALRTLISEVESAGQAASLLVRFEAEIARRMYLLNSARGQRLRLLLGLAAGQPGWLHAQFRRAYANYKRALSDAAVHRLHHSIVQ